MRWPIPHSMFLVFAFFMALVSCAPRKHKTDWRTSYDRNSKEPYGCYIAYHHLSTLYPEATIKPGRKVMAEIKKVLRDTKGTQVGHLLITVCRSFSVDSAEMELIAQYVRMGNHFVLLSDQVSWRVTDYVGMKQWPDTVSHRGDTLAAQKVSLYFHDTLHTYTFGGRIGNRFYSDDSLDPDEVYAFGFAGHSDNDPPNLLMRYDSNGSFLLSAAPVMFSNYVMLQGNNRRYYEQLLSYYNDYPSSVTWCSFLDKYAGEETDTDWRSLFKKPALLTAFLLILAMLLLYTLFAARRRQRIIPLREPLTNTSLDFVETVGRLYFLKGNHRNLAEKMMTHYLETLRHRYGLRTRELNNEFADLLAQRLNRPAEETRAHVAYLNYIRGSEAITEIDIQHLYHQLKKFQ